MIWGYPYFWKHPYVSRSYSLFSLFAGWQMEQHHTTPMCFFDSWPLTKSPDSCSNRQLEGAAPCFKWILNGWLTYSWLLIQCLLGAPFTDSRWIIKFRWMLQLEMFLSLPLPFKDIMLNHHLYSMGSMGSTAPKKTAPTFTGEISRRSSTDP